MRDQAGQVDRLRAEQDERLGSSPPETGGISATSSPSLQRGGALGVLLVDGVGQARRLGADLERGEDVARGRALRQLELARAGPRALPQRGEQPHGHAHAGLTRRRGTCCVLICVPPTVSTAFHGPGLPLTTPEPIQA